MKETGWLQPFEARWPALAHAEAPGLATLQGWIDAAGGRCRLIASARAGQTYEEAVAQGEVPTRPGSWHDVFNVLAFVRFPRAKAALHGRVLGLQRARRERAQPGRRSSEEDALTLLDEAVVLIAGSRRTLAPVRAARQADDLDALDEVVRAGDVRVVCFGHALLEHLHFGRAPIGAGVLEVEVDGEVTRERVDACLVRIVEDGALARPCFSPTVPWPDRRTDGWWRPDLF